MQSTGTYFPDFIVHRLLDSYGIVGIRYFKVKLSTVFYRGLSRNRIRSLQIIPNTYYVKYPGFHFNRSKHMFYGLTYVSDLRNLTTDDSNAS